jgi:hypothetical protein
LPWGRLSAGSASIARLQPLFSGQNRSRTLASRAPAGCPPGPKTVSCAAKRPPPTSVALKPYRPNPQESPAESVYRLRPPAALLPRRPAQGPRPFMAAVKASSAPRIANASETGRHLRVGVFSPALHRSLPRDVEMVEISCHGVPLRDAGTQMDSAFEISATRTSASSKEHGIDADTR